MAYINREMRIKLEAERLAQNARCQKIAKPVCRKVCQSCKDAHASYAESMIKYDIVKAKEFLEQWGYIIAE